jgi:cell division septum initiation protein DivIVA
MSEQMEPRVVSSAGQKRLADFLSECIESKKRKRDLEPLIVRKRRECIRLSEQIVKQKAQIKQLAQQLSAKEMLLDKVNGELEELSREWVVGDV